MSDEYWTPEEQKEFLGIIDPKVRHFLSELREEDIIFTFPAERDITYLSLKIMETLINYWNKESKNYSEWSQKRKQKEGENNIENSR